MPEELANQKQAEQQSPPSPAAVVPDNAAPVIGKRTAFQHIKRQLSSEDLNNPGTQKLILDLLDTIEQERDALKIELEKITPLFHAADKEAAVLREQLKTSKAIEIMFGLGIGLGCAIMGLAPFFWEPKEIYGQVTLATGAVLTLGSSLARIFK